MWSILKPRPLGSIPMRRITLFVSAMILALFATISINTAPLQAQTTDEPEENLMVTWSGDNLFYNGITLRESETTPPSNNEFVPAVGGTPCEGSENLYYSSVGTADSHPGDALVSVVCFDGDANSRTETIDATFLLYRTPLNGRETSEVPISEFTGGQIFEVEIAPEGVDGLGNPIEDEEEPTSTCSGEGTQGIGWIVCPVTRWLAAGMDALFGILESFLVVAPLSTSTDGPLFTMWRIMQNFANILFIGGFLIIIYSQITNFGLSNYGLKRLLPRLIVAAILVNVSYWICAVAVDLSNVFGASLHDVFTGIGETVQENSGSDVSFKDITWSAVAGAALTGAAGTFAIGGLVVGAVVSAGGSLWFLLVALVGVMVSALVAILVLAARQALITILIVISPLAFVAYLLPSTEKYFDRWRSLFMTMLLLYPLIAIVFGGAQLAGLVIIYGALANPSSPNFFNLIILGMIVQVAPVVITPLLIRLGGSLLGRIAGIVNDPNKGIVDRTRKFAQNRHDMTKNRQLWDRDENGNLRNHNPLALAGRWNAKREEHSASRLKAWQGGLHAEYERDDRSHEVFRQNRLNEMVKSTGEDDAKAHFEHSITNTAALREMYYQQRVNRDAAEAASKETGTLYEGLKADPETIAVGAMERRLGDRSREIDRDARSLASREATAKMVQERAYNARITDAANAELREFAGFNEIDPHGVARIVNIAQEAEAKTYQTLVDAGQRALQREEATLDELKEIIKNGTSSNPKFAHFSDDVESRSAAIREYISKAPVAHVHKLVEEMDVSSNAPLGTNEGVIRSEIAGAIQKRKPFYVSQTFLNQMAEGTLDPTFNGESGRFKMTLDTLNKFAFDAEAMVSIDQDDIGAVADFFERSPEAALLNADARAQITNALNEAFTSERYKGRMGKRRNNLNRVRRQLGLPEIRT